jgi:hypothetical protein
MGEAKRRAKFRVAAAAFCRPIKRARFALYTIGTRRAMAHYMGEELSWWSSHDERILGLVARDVTDNDFFWMILVRDRIGRFRCANIEVNYSSAPRAEEALQLEILKVLQFEDIREYGDQGDEIDEPTELLRLPTDCDPSLLHPYFRLLIDEPGREPARAVIREIAPWLNPKDPHLVTEFQNKGFDQRLWEIYLWAVFKEFSLDVELLEAPDFRCTGPGIDFTVEATTVSPTDKGALANHPNPKTSQELAEFLNGYMAIKFGSALHSKLNKTNKQGQHYWEREESRDKPFVLAIADFHKPADEDELGSMTYTQSALWQYLYGQRVYWEIVDGKLVIKPKEIVEHNFKQKVIPSGFFDFSKAENVSAVIFSNAGTLAKFDRMGVVAGFAAPGYGYARIGLKYNPDPNATMGTPFSIDVESDEYEEYWSQEIQVFHNPNAKNPLPSDWLPQATHHYFADGMLKSYTPSDAILSSFTVVMKYEES